MGGSGGGAMARGQSEVVQGVPATAATPHPREAGEEMRAAGGNHLPAKSTRSGRDERRGVVRASFDWRASGTSQPPAGNCGSRMVLAEVWLTAR